MNKNFLKECIKFNQDNINHMYSTLTKYQEHSEKLTANFMNLPFNKEMGGQGKEMVNQWSTLYKEGQENFKKLIDDGFKNIERIIG